MYILDGKLKKQGCISPIEEGYLYGYGLFETIKVYKGKMYFFSEHIRRLKGDLVKINLNSYIDIEKIEKSCYKLIETKNLKNGAIRITCSKRGQGKVISITTSERVYDEELYNTGFKLQFTNYRRNPISPLVGVKSNNFLENLLAREEGKKLGYDEVIFLNIHNQVCEGAISNIFWVKDGIVYTPEVECGLLPGIMRKKVIDIVEFSNIPLNIGKFNKDILKEADEIFITNSLMDVMPVSFLDNRSYNLDSNNITRRIMTEIKRLYG